MKSTFLLVAAICISLCSCKNSSTKQATTQQLSEHQYQKKALYMQDATGNLSYNWGNEYLSYSEQSGTMYCIYALQFSRNRMPYKFNGSPVRSIFAF